MKTGEHRRKNIEREWNEPTTRSKEEAAETDRVTKRDARMKGKDERVQRGRRSGEKPSVIRSRRSMTATIMITTAVTTKWLRNAEKTLRYRRPTG